MLRPHWGPLRSARFSTARILRSQIDPSNPEESALYKIKRPGMVFKEPMDPNWVLSRQPLYEGPIASQIAFTKRWSMGILAVGGYVGYLALGVVDFSPWLLAVPLSLPLPLIQWYAGSYVSRIFRVYRRDEPQTLENLERDETLMVEKLSLFGRSTYGVPIKVSTTFLANERHGWVNWAYIDPQRKSVTRLYVADNLGGLRMDRIWGIIERNSGTDNGRGFLSE